MSGYDYESTDEESAAHLAADHAEPDDDRPTLADELFGSGERDDVWVEETYRRETLQEISEETLDDDTVLTERVFTGRLMPDEEIDYERFCALCGCDVLGNDPHAPECPVEEPDDAPGA
jgi:hypothetical protein